MEEINPPVVYLDIRAMNRKVEQLIVAEIPRLRRYAHSLCMSREDGDDLVQSTLHRALSRVGYWQVGSNLRAWLMTIMHNLYVNQVKARKRSDATVSAVDEINGETTPEHDRKGLIIRDLERGLAKLSHEHREALLLIGMEQYSYKEAAKIAGVSIGTLTSRLHRARHELQTYMQGSTIRQIRRVK